MPIFNATVGLQTSDIVKKKKKKKNPTNVSVFRCRPHMGLVFAKESDGSADSSCFLRFGLKWKNVADTRNGDKSGKEKGE